MLYFVTFLEGLGRGYVTELVETLLHRCTKEEDSSVKVLLGTCLGEVGAIDVNRLGNIATVDYRAKDSSRSNRDAHFWQLSQPPWQSRPARYELQLVTKHLVIGLKGAPTSSDQHKIAFTIQQMLANLDQSAKLSGGDTANVVHIDCDATETGAKDAVEKGAMTQWLREKLEKADVLEVVEPYWSSRYKEVRDHYSFPGLLLLHSFLTKLCRPILSG